MTRRPRRPAKAAPVDPYPIVVETFRPIMAHNIDTQMKAARKLGIELDHEEFGIDRKASP